MAKKKVCIALSPEIAKRVAQFQSEHAISYFSSTVETLVTIAIDGTDLIAGLEESRRLNMEIARYTLAILAAISQNSNIPSEIKQAGRSSAEQMLAKAIQAAKSQAEENE